MPKDLRELQEHWFVSYIEDLIQVDSVRWLADIIEEPKIAFHSNSMIAQMNAAAGSLGIVLLPSFATRGRPDLVPVLPGLASTTREVWLNVHSDLQFAPRIRAVRAFLKHTLKQDPDMQVTLGASPAETAPQP
jgi:DNA-binding transcriptional LysR family regulator